MVRRLGTTTQSESDPALQRLIVDARAERPRGLPSHERHVELLAAAAFMAVAIPMAVLFSPPRSLNWGLAAALVVSYAIAARVRFHTGTYWTVPTQLIFVPMLFLLPTPVVPLFIPAALILGRLPEYLSGEVHPSRALLMIGDAWYAIGPALVLTLAGATSPDWGDWPIYLAALAAQFGFDLARAIVRTALGLGFPVGPLLRETSSICLVDTLLSPIGLLAAFASVDQQWAFLLLLPLIGLVASFAREREGRIDNAITLSQAYRGTAHLLGELLSNSDEYTGWHSRTVVILAHQVGRAMELDDQMVRKIEFGALLHDVGKITVPKEILNKDGPLNEEEWEVVHKHTLEGERMLERIGGVLADVGHVVRSHHEHFDGGGYPDGLRGEQIPVAARVISCCDAFDAMTSDRTYRDAMTVGDAIVELRANIGTQFDPEVVEALLGIVEGGEWHGGARPAPARPFTTQTPLSGY
jgi:HD domain-containing protein